MWYEILQRPITDPIWWDWMKWAREIEQDRIAYRRSIGRRRAPFEKDADYHGALAEIAGGDRYGLPVDSSWHETDDIWWDFATPMQGEEATIDAKGGRGLNLIHAYGTRCADICLLGWFHDGHGDYPDHIIFRGWHWGSVVAAQPATRLKSLVHLIPHDKLQPMSMLDLLMAQRDELTLIDPFYRETR